MTTSAIRTALERLVELHNADGAWGLHWDDAMGAARTALDAEPAGEGPSEEEIDAFIHQWWELYGKGYLPNSSDKPLITAALARWARPAAPAAPEPGEVQRDAVIAAVTEALGNAYDCLRVWEAWSVGTMGQDDFALVAEDSDRVAEIADAAIEAMRPATPAALEAVEAWLAGQAAEEVAL